MTAPEFVYSVLLRPRPLRSATNFLLRAGVPRDVVRHGATIVLNPQDPIISGALALRVYEREETQFFLSACRPGMTFLDIGANCGYYTALFLTHAGPESRVIALEPDPECFEFLERTVAANQGRRVSCLRMAAADKRSTGQLHRNVDNRGDNRMYPNDLATAACEVQTDTVDSVLAELKIRDVSLIKMDVQGFEGRVVAGMLDTMRQSRELVIMSEFWPWGLTQAGSEPIAFLKAFLELGFELFSLTRAGRLTKLGDFGRLIDSLTGRKYTNIVAIKGTGQRFLDGNHA